VDVTGPYNWVRSYAIAVATVTGRKRVLAMVNPSWPGDPANPALGHTTTNYDDMGNLIGVGSPDSGTTTYGVPAGGDHLVEDNRERHPNDLFERDILYRIDQRLGSRVKTSPDAKKTPFCEKRSRPSLPSGADRFSLTVLPAVCNLHQHPRSFSSFPGFSRSVSAAPVTHQN